MTTQISDSIEFRGESCALYSDPLSSYLRHHRPELKMGGLSEVTWNYRGYECEWRIYANRLQLVKVAGSTDTGSVGLNGLFSDAEGPVDATWFTGDLSIQVGPAIDKPHFEFGAYSALEVLVQVCDGVVVGEREIRHEPRSYSRQPDVFVIGENSFPLHSFPLEPLLAAMQPRLALRAIANGRDYVALWQVTGTHLHLIELNARTEAYDDAFDSIFPGKELPLVASWYTGELRIQFGAPVGRTEERPYCNAIYGAELVLKVKDGEVQGLEGLPDLAASVQFLTK